MNLQCYELAVQFYRLMRIKKIPGPLKGQLQRAASSVALNLAEGWGALLQIGKGSSNRFWKSQRDTGHYST